MKHSVLRILALSFALLILSVTFAACGGDNDTGLVFKSGDTEIAIGAKADPIVQSLGTPDSKSESPSCGFPGTDYLYLYQSKGLRISTTPDESGASVVCKIELMSDLVSTPEGLKIGMSADAAKTAMNGTDASLEAAGENLIYTAGNMRLRVNCVGGSVTAITYISLDKDNA